MDDCSAGTAPASRAPLRVAAHGRPPWPLHGAALSRLIEQHAQQGLPTHTLMQRAGASVARFALAIAPHARGIWVACGPGNNGGDGLEAAMHLHRAGKRVQVGLLGDPTRLPPDAAASLRRAQAAGVPITDSASPPTVPSCHDLAIDALLGVGGARAPQGALAAAVMHLRHWPGTVLCVDLPSGLHPDTGQAFEESGDVVRGHHTVSLLTLKPGLFTGSGRDHAGQVWFDDLQTGLREPPTAWLFSKSASIEPGRRHSQHKGSFGDVLVLGGAAGMTGAALLAGRAALVAGAGRVFVHTLGDPAWPVDTMTPELMFRDAAAVEAMNWAPLTLVCGCGGGTVVRAMLPRALSHAGRLVLDADALNAIAADPMLQSLLEGRGRRGAATILTPHPLEAARLLGVEEAATVQSDRLRAARQLADRYRSVVVLKGSGSVVAAPDTVPSINFTGNAALASAGTGDVLAGWMAGLWPQGRDALLAAQLATHAHGAAADRWVASHGHQGPLPASRLIELLAGYPP
ncbi:NAD(P)H-hydrate dehydratase [Schlegelella sp. S2-27]|uniref:Bifunctional NAD(P)H-hydrate repair enzyme n=1 Tax=Caldimonas mangrovi TaxID=2944811 RepID=A0ABT0YQL2_9BURK|nr:NAD(P)H-hydrate dehydratase [Caldimonas mangrovi]MCM5681021.1 NAD(P)H-hydrate dehydratase [Caldimonas mangrovi]